MKEQSFQETYLKDYQPSLYKIPRIELLVELDDTRTRVTSKMTIVRNHKESSSDDRELVLDGKNLELIFIKVKDVFLNDEQFYKDATSLTLRETSQYGDEFDMEIVTMIDPQANLSLDGLYKSKSLFCTQNEPEGFRKITYFLDRPDVMSLFTTNIIANKKKHPTLLSNGNLIFTKKVESDRHHVQWKDPFPKPAYLYALVGGDLDYIEDYYITLRSRKIVLKIYCDKGKSLQCSFAMKSLKKAMKWDEDCFGLEYDLDIFMIVAVDAFNMGAMENKGLNIFNSSCILVDEKMTTDAGFLRVESIIAHEYFHNWTGNRVTCRDWFQLTLKEGLTVYRDQEFTSDLHHRGIARISTVEILRVAQFQEDRGPLAHPIKPESYMEINNFYTSTIYQKGAEIVRMVATLLSKDGFRKGMDKYFELFDGQAVRTEDFLYAMSVANDDYDFTQFKNWYRIAGTPEIEVFKEYNSIEREYVLKIKQKPSKVRIGSEDNEPFQIPLFYTLLDPQEKRALNVSNNLLILTRWEEKFVFKNIKSCPILSINQNFTAPVIVREYFEDKNDHLSELEELAFLMIYDTDDFNRYEASQKMSSLLFLDLLKRWQEKKTLKISPLLLDSFSKIFSDKKMEDLLRSYCLSIPMERKLHQLQDTIDYQGTFAVREFMKEEIGDYFQENFFTLYDRCNRQNSTVGERTLKNHSLEYLLLAKHEDGLRLAEEQFEKSQNMTDEYASFRSLITYGSKECSTLIERKFYSKWKSNDLVIQKWFMALAAIHPLEKIQALEQDPCFDIKIPNFVTSLFQYFASLNCKEFHREDGRCYRYLGEKILEIDRMNPCQAASLCEAFKSYRQMQTKNKEQVRLVLDSILEKKSSLSSNLYEIAYKISTIEVR